MKTKLMILLASAALIASAYSEAQKSDSDTLQGKWEGTEKGATPAGPCYLTITGKTLDYHGVETNDWCKAAFTLREDAHPKQMIAVIKDCSDSDAIGKTICIIYRLEERSLTISGNGPGETNFPSAFDAAGARQFVFKHK